MSFGKTDATLLSVMVTAGVLAGCSFQSVINRVVDPARQAAIIADARHFCTNIEQLRPQFDAEAWAHSAQDFASISRECPRGAADYAITGYRFNSFTASGGPTVLQEFATVVASTPSRWAEIDVTYASRDGAPPRIVAWRVVGADAPPPSLATVKQWDDALVWFRLGGAVVLLLLIGGLVWLIRRVRRRGSRSLLDA